MYKVVKRFAGPAVLLALTSATAAPIVDQVSPFDPSPSFSLAIGGQSDQVLAQVVTAGVSGTLVGVNLPLLGSSGVLTLELQGVTNGLPNGTSLLFEPFAGAAIPAPGTDGFRELTFLSPVAFSAGDMFAFVLRSPNSFGINPTLPGDPYGGGSAFFDSRPNPPGVWVPLSRSDDLAFQTVVDPVPEPSSLVFLIIGLGALFAASAKSGR